MKKVVFMGTPDYAGVILQALLEEKEIEVVGVFTQPDKPVGRKQVLTPPFVKKFLVDNGYDIKVYQPKTLKDEVVAKDILSLAPDFIVVAAYGQILPKEILDIAPCINLHASLLPKYRGASPIQEVLLNDEKYTGVTAMLMDEGLDTGDMLGFLVVEVSKGMIVGKLFDKLSVSAAKLCITVLKEFDKIKPIGQFGALKSYSKKIKRGDGLISFDDAKEIFLKYKAYTPWPGIYLENGLKIKKISLEDENKAFNEGKTILCENRIIRKGAQFVTIKKANGWDLEGENFVSPVYVRPFFTARCIVENN